MAWHSKKMIYEIQCSPIPFEEVQCRILDYISIGYEVIWILHDKQFNRKNLSAAESFLRNLPCYFTDIDKLGDGIVYDQFEVLKDHRRLFKGPPLTVSLEKFFRLPAVVPPDFVLPQIVSSRFEKWKCYMEGDLLHRLLKEGHLSQSIKKMLTLEQQILGSHEEKVAEIKRLPFKTLIIKSYRFLIDHLLKTFSRS